MATKNKNIFSDLKDDTKEFTKKEIKDGKGLAVFAYLVPFIPYFIEKKNKYVRYHANQGMNLLIVAGIYSIVYYIFCFIFVFVYITTNCYLHNLELCKYNFEFLPWFLFIPFRLIGLCIAALSILGVVNVFQDKAKELPIINKIKIFK